MHCQQTRKSEGFACGGRGQALPLLRQGLELRPLPHSSVVGREQQEPFLAVGQLRDDRAGYLERLLEVMRRGLKLGQIEASIETFRIAVQYLLKRLSGLLRFSFKD